MYLFKTNIYACTLTRGGRLRMLTRRSARVFDFSCNLFEELKFDPPEVIRLCTALEKCEGESLLLSVDNGKGAVVALTEGFYLSRVLFLIELPLGYPDAEKMMQDPCAEKIKPLWSDVLGEVERFSAFVRCDLCDNGLPSMLIWRAEQICREIGCELENTCEMPDAAEYIGGNRFAGEFAYTLLAVFAMYARMYSGSHNLCLSIGEMYGKSTISLKVELPDEEDVLCGYRTLKSAAVYAGMQFESVREGNFVRIYAVPYYADTPGYDVMQPIDLFDNIEGERKWQNTDAEE